MTQSNNVHCITMSILSGFQIPFICLGFVLFHSFTMVITTPNSVHSIGIPFFS